MSLTEPSRTVLPLRQRVSLIAKVSALRRKSLRQVRLLLIVGD
jgi:hypothetical protein